MIYYTIIYYTTVLCYTLLYYTILYYAILYYTILYTIQYYTILYYTILYYTILYYNLIWYSMSTGAPTYFAKHHMLILKPLLRAIVVSVMVTTHCISHIIFKHACYNTIDCILRM